VAPLDHFNTARLRADRLELRDFDDLYRMHRDLQMMKSLGGLRSEEQTREYLQVNLAHWERYGFGLWMLREAESAVVVGRSAIRHVDVEGQPEVELGYALLPACWGRGLATEVARGMLGLAFSELQLRELVAFSLLDNLASRRVMEKSGGTYEREVVHGGHLHVLYRFRRGI
jgi:RimJ/RimL family protein N-acetyltransferase